MKKVVSLVVSLIMLFSLMSVSMISANAEAASFQLSNVSETQLAGGNCKYYSSITAVKGTEADDFILNLKLSSALSGTGKGFYISIPEATWNNITENYNVTKIALKIRTDAALTVKAYMADNSLVSTQTQNPSSSVAEQSKTVTFGTTATSVSFNFTETALTNKRRVFYFYHSSSSSMTNVYVESATVYYEAAATEYSVIIDSVATKVAEGETYTFPDTADLYIGEGTMYQSGDTVTVNSDIAFTSYDLGLSMQNGASIRLNAENGIRFYTDINESAVDNLKAAGAIVELGTIIAPETLITDEFTHEDDNIDVKYEAELGGRWNASGFVGSIIRIKDTNVTKNFVGRGYAKVTINSVTKTVYAAQNDNSRSVAYIANAYKNANYNGDLLSDSIKEIVDAWAAAYTA